MPFRDQPFVFESGEFTYVAGGDYNSGASRLIFKLAKFNKKLKCVEKMKYRYKRNRGGYLDAAGYRHLKMGNYLSFFYSDRTDENTKVYSQKVDIEKMRFEGKPRLLLDINSKDDWYNREISCVKSPDGNFMLLVISGKATQAQYLFDDKENLVYVKRNELKGYKLWVTNEGRVLGIRDVNDLGKISSTFSLSDIRLLKDEPRFILLVMDKDGKASYQAYNPEANIYARYRKWTKYTTHSSYNSITKQTDFSTSVSFKSATQLSYQFKLLNNTLYSFHL